MTPTRRILIALTALLACLAVAAPGLAAGGKKYKGKTEQSRPVTFTKKGKKIVKFRGGVNAFCIGKGIEFRTAIPPKAMKVKKGGKFRYKGRDKGDDTDIVIRGKLKKGGKASGIVQMNYTWYDSSTGYFQGCSGKAKWHAKRV